MVVVEAYPDLKANQNFLQLQSQLEGTENRISVARRDYIAAVQHIQHGNPHVPRPHLARADVRDMKVRESFEANERRVRNRTDRQILMRTALLLVALLLRQLRARNRLSAVDRSRRRCGRHSRARARAPISTRQLEAHEQATGEQIVVATVPDLGGLPIEDYGYQLGRHWGIGRQGTRQRRAADRREGRTQGAHRGRLRARRRSHRRDVVEHHQHAHRAGVRNAAISTAACAPV